MGRIGVGEVVRRVQVTAAVDTVGTMLVVVEALLLGMVLVMGVTEVVCKRSEKEKWRVDVRLM